MQTSVVSTSPGTPVLPAPALGVGGDFLVVVFLTDEGKEGDLQPLWSSLTSALGVLGGKKSRGVKTSWGSCISSFSF